MDFRESLTMAMLQFGLNTLYSMHFINFSLAVSLPFSRYCQYSLSIGRSETEAFSGRLASLLPRLCFLQHSTSLDLPAPSADVSLPTSSDSNFPHSLRHSAIPSSMFRGLSPHSRFHPRRSSISPHLRSAFSTFPSARFRQFTFSTMVDPLQAHPMHFSMFVDITRLHSAFLARHS
jgi:hypothetical protein